jgi:hypothetical protein
MKKLVQVVDVDNEGIVTLLGKKVMVFCMNYIYAGTLEGVNADTILLANSSIVYETGELVGEDWKDSQPMPAPVYIRCNCIESICESGR